MLNNFKVKFLLSLAIYRFTFGKFLKPFVSVNKDFLNFCLFRYFKNYLNIFTLMCMLWPLCLQLAYASGTDSCIDHTCIRYL